MSKPVLSSVFTLAFILILAEHVIAHGGPIVIMTEDGFSPDYLKIPVGTTVSWVTVGENMHWPASDLHPTHTIYPGSGIEKCNASGKDKILDACRGLNEVDEYEFTFDKEGKWGIHDHLYPGFTMVVQVGNPGDRPGIIDAIKNFLSRISGFFIKLETKLLSQESFRSLDYQKQQKEMDRVSGSDPASAWSYLKQVFTVNGQITENPHELAHIVGNWIYKKEGIGGIGICDPTFAFGCYHGVIEKMLLDLGKGAISEIEDTCVEIFPEQLALTASCVHGTGHGLATWEGLDIENALEDCDMLEPQHRAYCYDGVLMENSFSAISVNEKDAWNLCSGLDEKYHYVCAKYHTYSMGKSLNWDNARLAKSCADAPTQLLKDSCFTGFGFFVANIARGNSKGIEELCSLSPVEDGRYHCTMSAAIEVIFQEYSGWTDTYTKLCGNLPGGWKEECDARTGYTIVAYKRQSVEEQPEEILKIKSLENLDDQVPIYNALIERVGPEQAQEYLYRSGMPFTGQTHLLNHVSGDYIYEKYGAAGLVKCKDYYLASCYHGFILRAVADEGFDGMGGIISECQKYGLSVTAQCSHAMGHGFLAWVGYANMPKALGLCDRMTEMTENFPGFNCRDGVFMENIWGVHNGEPSADRWVNESDLFYPCNDPRIDQDHVDGCWANQPSLMYQILKGDLKKIGGLCLEIQNSSHQRICFNALARQIHPLTKGNLNSSLQLCGILPPEWIDFCLSTISVSDFSVGGRRLSYEICSVMTYPGKLECYQGLFGIMSVYARSDSEYESFCSHVLEDEWMPTCLSGRHG